MALGAALPAGLLRASWPSRSSLALSSSMRASRRDGGGGDSAPLLESYGGEEEDAAAVGSGSSSVSSCGRAGPGFRPLEEEEDHSAVQAEEWVAGARERDELDSNFCSLPGARELLYTEEDVATAACVGSGGCGHGRLASRYSCAAVGRRLRFSKRRHTWSLFPFGCEAELPGVEVVRVELKHSRISGKKQVFVDGACVLTTREPSMTWSFDRVWALYRRDAGVTACFACGDGGCSLCPGRETHTARISLQSTRGQHALLCEDLPPTQADAQVESSVWINSASATAFAARTDRRDSRSSCASSRSNESLPLPLDECSGGDAAESLTKAPSDEIIKPIDKSTASSTLASKLARLRAVTCSALDRKLESDSVPLRSAWAKELVASHAPAAVGVPSGGVDDGSCCTRSTVGSLIGRCKGSNLPGAVGSPQASSLVKSASAPSFDNSKIDAVDTSPSLSSGKLMDHTQATCDTCTPSRSLRRGAGAAASTPCRPLRREAGFTDDCCLTRSYCGDCRVKEACIRELAAENAELRRALAEREKHLARTVARLAELESHRLGTAAGADADVPRRSAGLPARAVASSASVFVESGSCAGVDGLSDTSSDGESASDSDCEPDPPKLAESAGQVSGWRARAGLDFQVREAVAEEDEDAKDAEEAELALEGELDCTIRHGCDDITGDLLEATVEMQDAAELYASDLDDDDIDDDELGCTRRRGPALDVACAPAQLVSAAASGSSSGVSTPRADVFEDDGDGDAADAAGAAAAPDCCGEGASDATAPALAPPSEAYQQLEEGLSELESDEDDELGCTHRRGPVADASDVNATAETPLAERWPECSPSASDDHWGRLSDDDLEGEELECTRRILAEPSPPEPTAPALEVADSLEATAEAVAHAAPEPASAPVDDAWSASRRPPAFSARCFLGSALS
eukprot:TRINITY_DN26112_c0_g4_i1.p1 TRINITY_DN26112_c0_g4~~TRINITY_DN26112_c0_g4_i1.p1  ORF type:complete len:988 (-),score=226.49 TRINITY_DN26112_c0_g4_i1:94-2862(-)